MKKNYEELKEDMTTIQIVKFIFFHSFFCIVCKVLITLKDSITVSFIGHLQGNKLSPYFISTLIQNIGFYGVGYGFATTANMLASRFLGHNKLEQVGQTVNRGKIIVLFYSFVCLLLSFVGKGLFTLLFPNGNIDLVSTFLTNNCISVFFNLQITMQMIYLNVHNNYISPAALDLSAILSQFAIFKIFFYIFKSDILASDEFTFILTAWCLNITSFLQYLYYTIYIYIYYSKSATYVKFNKSSFKVSEYLNVSIHFLFFFVSHFLGGEQLNIIINNYYGKKTNFFDAFSISQKIYFLLQKFSMGFGFLLMNVTGYLNTKSLYGLLKRITKWYFICSFGVILILFILAESLANPIANIYTDKEDILEYVPLYMRIISIIIIPYHLENSLQAVLTGHNKQKFAAYFSIILTVAGGMGFGFLFIYGLNFGVGGIFITLFILEVLFSVVNLFISLKINYDDNIETLITEDESDDQSILPDSLQI